MYIEFLYKYYSNTDVRMDHLHLGVKRTGYAFPSVQLRLV